jgi:hypothetical protein
MRSAGRLRDVLHRHLAASWRGAGQAGTAMTDSRRPASGQSAGEALRSESRTSPFHQAHILLLLTGRLLLNDGSGSTFDLRLVPDLSPEIARLILGDDTQIAGTEDEAERLVFRAMEHGRRRLPGPAARRLLRQLRPLHAALLDAVPEAARPEVPGRPGPRVRLHRAVVEIREAVLALRPYVDPELAAAARKVMHPAGLAEGEAVAAAEASVLAAALRARVSGPPALAAGGVPGWQHMPGPDLPSEAAWLARVARAFDRGSLAGAGGLSALPESPRKVS